MGSFLEVQDQTLDYERQQSWADKIPKLFWRGAFMVDIRRKLRDVAQKYPWGKLLRSNDQLQHFVPILTRFLGRTGDVNEINWGDLKDDLRTPAEHCQYKYLAQVEGHAYSGRLK